MLPTVTRRGLVAEAAMIIAPSLSQLDHNGKHVATLTTAGVPQWQACVHSNDNHQECPLSSRLRTCKVTQFWQYNNRQQYLGSCWLLQHPCYRICMRYLGARYPFEMRRLTLQAWMTMHTIFTGCIVFQLQRPRLLDKMLSNSTSQATLASPLWRRTLLTSR